MGTALFYCDQLMCEMLIFLCCLNTLMTHQYTQTYYWPGVDSREDQLCEKIKNVSYVLVLSSRWKVRWGKRVGCGCRRIHCASFSCKACSTKTSVIIVYTLSRRGFALTCGMETGIAVDILSCKLHLTIRNSMNLDIQHLRSSIWKYVKTKEPPCTEPYARWCGRR